MGLLRSLFFVVGGTIVSLPFLMHVSFHSLSNIGDREHINPLASVLANSKVSSSFHQSSGSRWSGASLLPNQKYPLENPPKDSPYTILHTVTTRFMVGQAPNVTSGSTQFDIQKARYLLFETFCWPTVKHQTSANFYWLVLVDPGLDKTIIKGIRDLLSSDHFPSGNAYLVLTNNTKWASDGIGVENSTSYGVGLQPVAQEFREGTLPILTGNRDHLYRALDAMEGKDATSLINAWAFPTNKKPVMIIETLLDADDGLNNHAVEWIQNTAVRRTKQHRLFQQQKLEASTTSSSMLSPSLNSTWWFLCGTDHIEWHNRLIFQLTEEKYKKTGISSGLVGLRQSPLFCTSAGFTRIGIASLPSASSGNADYSHVVFPKDGYSNHALTFYFPECSNTSIANGNYSACWHREYPKDAFVLKSRTITSDSMDHLNVGRMKDYRDVSWLNASDYPLLINDTKHLWETLHDDFSIERNKAWELSVFIYEHRNSILHQNKESRCSPGFPCFKVAKRNLLRMERYWKKQSQIAKEKAMNATLAANKRELEQKHAIDLVIKGSKHQSALRKMKK